MHRRWRIYRQAELHRGAWTALLLAGLFTGLILVTRLLCRDEAGNTSFFPANAAVVAAILVLPPRLGLATGLVCLAVNVAVNAVFGDSLYDVCRLPVLNFALSYLTAFLTRSLCGAAIDLTRTRRLLMFTGICVFAATLESGIGILGDPADPRGKLGNWLQWGLCDGLGLLLGTPALLLMLRRRESDLAGNAGELERWLLLAGTMLLSVLAFQWVQSPLIFMLYPALILTAFRAGPAWVLTSVLLVCLVASAMTAHGLGALTMLSNAGHLMRGYIMQPFLLSLFLAALPPNNALGERTRTARRLTRLKTAIEHDATHDALTGLANRVLFRRRLASALQAGLLRAVIFVDTDHFKAVNDTLGHQAGDALLRQFGARLVAAVPDTALVARFGGDEFAILLRHGGKPADITAVAKAILAGVEAPFDLTEGPARVSASVGIALVSIDSTQAGELMRKADIALYAAKEAGRNCWRLFTDELDAEIQLRAELEHDLRAALSGAGGLMLHYQFKQDCAGVVRGAEALLRWNHPRFGLISPSRFIRVAEETGLIVPLGTWVMREAAAFAGRWPDLHVAVHVSPSQLHHATFVAATLQTFRDASVPAARIELEVTETVLQGDSSAAENSLNRLREAGVRIALDDFGIGYSSMRQLQRFKPDRIKIDRSFVAGMESGAEAAAIVEAVVNLGHAMNVQVTAEGVETEGQRRMLIDMGVDEMQGCLFHSPTDEAALLPVATPVPAADIAVA
jgi:diguanylate cyclase (GGDEF)-like protein